MTIILPEMRLVNTEMSRTLSTEAFLFQSIQKNKKPRLCNPEARTDEAEEEETVTQYT